jgi:hypothetical protein
VEQQQDEPEGGEQLEVLGMLDEGDAGGVGPEDHAGDHEEGDRR